MRNVLILRIQKKKVRPSYIDFKFLSKIVLAPKQTGNVIMVIKGKSKAESAYL
jgi:hypothetical protein